MFGGEQAQTLKIMLLIGALILVGLLLLVVELVFLPGTTIAGICSFIALGFSVYRAYILYDTPGAMIVVGVIAALAVATVIISLKMRTWQRFSLKDNIDGISQPRPEEALHVGERGITVTRLAPMGKALFANTTYEVKSIDAYVDPRTEVEVVGFENFNAIVKTITDK